MGASTETDLWWSLSFVYYLVNIDKRSQAPSQAKCNSCIGVWPHTTTTTSHPSGNCWFLRSYLSAGGTEWSSCYHHTLLTVLFSVSDSFTKGADNGNGAETDTTPLSSPTQTVCPDISYQATHNIYWGGEQPSDGPNRFRKIEYWILDEMGFSVLEDWFDLVTIFFPGKESVWYENIL